MRWIRWRKVVGTHRKVTAMGEEDITGEVHEKDVVRAQAERLEPQVMRKKEVSPLKGCRCQDCLLLSKEVARELREGRGTSSVFGDVSAKVSKRWKALNIEERRLQRGDSRAFRSHP